MSVTTPFVSVVLDVPSLPALTYRVPEGMVARIGDRCLVPLGRRQEVGIVVALHNQTDIAENKQKSLIHLFSETAPLSDIWLKLTKFASDYYQHGWGEVAIASLPTFFPKQTRSEIPAIFRSVEKTL